MNDRLYKIILQGAVLVCFIIIACREILDKASITMIFGTIVGYAYATGKEAYIKGNGNDKNE
jgi:hypothetical protein